MKIYLSGKVTGEKYAETYKKFKAEEVKLSTIGYEVTNPLSYIEENASWNNAMKKAIALMMHCDAIYLLPDWDKSKGAIMEFTIAVKLGFGIYYANDLRHLEQVANMVKK